MRVEKDILGVVEIPEHTYYGIQTMRALRNFAISGRTIAEYQYLLRSIALIKKVAAMSNYEAGALSYQQHLAICQASDEVISGKLQNHFPIDIYHAGGGVSINMNVNEVIANRANEWMIESKESIHPNQHVNMSQSTNDVLSSAMKMACYYHIEDLLNSLSILEKSLQRKTKEFSSIVKVARTCLQDAVPITLGQEFSGYHSFIKRQMRALTTLQEDCLTIVIGATAVGTGVGASKDYLEKMYKYLPKVSGLPLKKAENFFDGLQNADIFLKVSSVLKGLATGLSKFSSDLRLLSSGPRAGFGELTLPAVQPGSSIMPGKINPCIPEMMMQVCFDVYGNDQTITFAVDRGELDLNVWEPIIFKNIYDSFCTLTNAIVLFTEHCVEGLIANDEHCLLGAENSLSLIVALSSIFNYQQANDIVLEAYENNISIKEVIVNKKLMDEEKASKLLNPLNITNVENLDL